MPRRPRVKEPDGTESPQGVAAALLDAPVELGPEVCVAAAEPTAVAVESARKPDRRPLPDLTPEPAAAAAPARLVLDGDLTIRRIGEVSAQIRRALDASPCVELVIDGNAQCDLSMLQVICSAHRTVVERPGGEVRLAGSLPPVLRRFGLETGQCRAGAERGVKCLWGDQSR